MTPLPVVNLGRSTIGQSFLIRMLPDQTNPRQSFVSAWYGEDPSSGRKLMRYACYAIVNDVISILQFGTSLLAKCQTLSEQGMLPWNIREDIAFTVRVKELSGFPSFDIITLRSDEFILFRDGDSREELIKRLPSQSLVEATQEWVDNLEKHAKLQKVAEKYNV